jgi:hypothetical protein
LLSESAKIIKEFPMTIVMITPKKIIEASIILLRCSFFRNHLQFL